MNSSDIIIFRKKNYNYLFSSFKTLSLDNEIAIVVDKNNLLQIKNYKVNIKNLNSILNYEYYHYHSNCKINLDQD